MEMNYIDRAIQQEFSDKVRPGKVLILLGARRVGKTELIKNYLKELDSNDYLLFNGEDQRTLDLFAERSVSNYKRLLEGKALLVIDEAQKIPEVGLKLKLIVDSFKEIKVIATGSSVFDLSNKLGEPLVGRSNLIYLFPMAQMEYASVEDYLTTRAKLEERLLFGSYPELGVYEDWNEKINYLEGIVNNYLLRDILEFEGIRKSNKIMDLLRLVAFQLGKEVSIDELASSLKGVSRNTVEAYLDLLSKVFIIYNVRGFSRNLRKEISKSSRWYFYDNGIRNAIIRNYNRLDLRNDVGDLWENYLMGERIKYNSYKRKLVNHYFWRTYDQQELDLIEEEASLLRGYEFKWNPKKKAKVPLAWKRAYSEASFQLINTENYLDFIS